jgi:phage gp36-like protein
MLVGGLPYCQPADLALYALNPLALANVPYASQLAACAAASEKADSYMRGRYSLPMVAVGTDVVMHTAFLAGKILLSTRGYNPAAGADDRIEKQWDDAVRWFEGIQRQSVHPDVTPSGSSPGGSGNPAFDLPQVITQPQRGWQQTSGGGTPSVS